MATITKTPAIVDSYYVDFVNELAQGETLSHAQVTAFDKTLGADATAKIVAANPAPAISGTQVTFWYQNGDVGKNYVISVEVTTSAGRTLEGDVDLTIVPEISP